MFWGQVTQGLMGYSETRISPFPQNKKGDLWMTLCRRRTQIGLFLKDLPQLCVE